MTATEKITYILKCIVENGTSITFLNKRFISQNAPFEVWYAGTELDEMIEKLRKDGYIYEELVSKDLDSSECYNYRPTFEGRLFSENGGYVGEQKRVRRKDFFSQAAIWITAIGGVFAAVYAIYDIIKDKPFGLSILNASLIFLFGGVAGVLILSICRRTL